LLSHGLEKEALTIEVRGPHESPDEECLMGTGEQDWRRVGIGFLKT